MDRKDNNIFRETFPALILNELEEILGKDCFIKYFNLASPDKFYSSDYQVFSKHFCGWLCFLHSAAPYIFIVLYITAAIIHILIDNGSSIWFTCTSWSLIIINVYIFFITKIDINRKKEEAAKFGVFCNTDNSISIFNVTEDNEMCVLYRIFSIDKLEFTKEYIFIKPKELITNLGEFENTDISLPRVFKPEFENVLNDILINSKAGDKVEKEN